MQINKLHTRVRAHTYMVKKIKTNDKIKMYLKNEGPRVCSSKLWLI